MVVSECYIIAGYTAFSIRRIQTYKVKVRHNTGKPLCKSCFEISSLPWSVALQCRQSWQLPRDIQLVKTLAQINEGTFFFIARGEDLNENPSIHAENQSSIDNTSARHRQRCALWVCYYRSHGIDRIRGIKQIKIRMADDKVYVSVESNSLNPAFVSATAIADVVTRTTRELLLVLDSLEDANVISADVVRLAPSPI